MATVTERIVGLRTWIFLALFGVFALAAGINIHAILSVGYPDWYMYTIMWAVLLIYFLIVARDVSSGRRVGAIVNLALFLIMSGFWIWILAGLVDARPTLRHGQVVQRESMGQLWGSIVLLGLTASALVGMVVVAMRKPTEEVPAPKVEPAAPVVEPPAPVVAPEAPVVKPAAPAIAPPAPVVAPAAPKVEPPTQG